MPGLIDLYEAHKEQRDAFELIVIHSSSLDTLAAVDEKMAVIKQKERIKPRWRGRDFPFPILLDDQHKTFKAYGVRALPTTILIDPAGKLFRGAVGRGQIIEKLLEQKLEAARNRQEKGTPQRPTVVRLSPRVPDGKRALRWSPMGAKIALESRRAGLRGSFALGPKETPALGIRLEKSEGATHYDRLWIDRNRDGRFGAGELLTTKPREKRHKFWSSFRTTVNIPVREQKDQKGPSLRPYAMNLWFVVDPREPASELVLRWSRRGWHQGEVTLDGTKALVLLTEMRMDGVFDRNDSWALAVDESTLLAPRISRRLSQHVWLGERAYRVTRIDPHGFTLVIEPYDPGISRAEEEKRNDRLAVDRQAKRAKRPLLFRRDFAKAEADARVSRKLLFVDFETTWCGPCKTMDRWVYTAEMVVSAAAGIIAVKVDGDEHRDLVRRFAVTAYPTMILLSASGVEIRRARGYRGVDAMAKFFAPPEDEKKR